MLRNKVSRTISFITCLSLLLFTSGCGQQEGSPSGETGKQENSENTPIGTEWKAMGFSYTENAFNPSEETLSFQEIRGSVFEETEPEFRYTDKRSVVAYLRDTCYVLYSYKQQQGQRFVLEKRQSDVEKPEQLELFGGSNQVSAGYVACMDVVTESDIAVLFVNVTGSWDGKAKEYLLLHLDGEGNVTSQTELLSSYQEKGVKDFDLAQGCWWCDEQGYSYVLANEGKTLTIFDAKGEFVMSQDYSSEDYVNLETAFHAPDGSLIFSLSDSGQGATKLIWLDTGKKQWKELASIGAPYLKQFTMLENGLVYYSRGSSLIKWDVQTGKQETIYKAMPSGMMVYAAHVSVTEQEELTLYIVRPDRVDVRVLSDKVPETEGITLVDFAGQSPFLQTCAADYNRAGDNVRINYKTGGKDEEALWTRTMAELVAGKGPDVLCLWVDSGRLQTLYEKGVLADLTELVPKEILDQVFPGVLATGTVDGSLVGLAVDATARVMVTSNELWQQDSWTVDDVLEIMEAHPDLERMFLMEGAETSPSSILYWMGLQHVENAPFVDFGRKESHFTDGKFQKMLELAKTYGKAPRPSEEIGTLLREGRCLAAFPDDVRSAENFVNVVERYGEGCHFIGYPGQTDYVGYWTNMYLIVVNKQSEHLDAIAEFLSQVLSAENQRKVYQLSVREDVMRQYVGWVDYGDGGKWYYEKYGGTAQESLSGIPFSKPNGECYIDDYMDFLRRLGPQKVYGTVISDIAWDEARYYFDGSKNAEQVGEVIDSRVQQYLNE